MEATQPARKPRVKLWRVAVLLCLVMFGLWFLSVVGTHIMVWRYARAESAYPGADIMPQSLPDKRIANLSNGTNISAFGFSFRVPWPKVAFRNDGKSFVFTKFESGAIVSVWDQSQTPIGPGIPAGASNSQTEDMNRFFGRKAVASRYGYFKAMMDASPRDISFFHPRANGKAMVLLALKSIHVQKATAVYLVASTSVQGYQIGDPEKLPKAIQLILFDAKDREYCLILHGTTGPGALTQESINAIVASFQPPQ